MNPKVKNENTKEINSRFQRQLQIAEDSIIMQVHDKIMGTNSKVWDDNHKEWVDSGDMDRDRIHGMSTHLDEGKMSLIYLYGGVYDCKVDIRFDIKINKKQVIKDWLEGWFRLLSVKGLAEGAGADVLFTVKLNPVIDFETLKSLEVIPEDFTKEDLCDFFRWLRANEKDAKQALRELHGIV